MVPRCTNVERRRATGSDPEAWLDEHGDYLFRYALHRVHEAEVAEDLVQETFLAALEGFARFDERSRLRTWLTGILRHKIADHFRARSREAPARTPDERRLEAWSDALFDDSGTWREKPGPWSAWPADAPEADELARVLEACLAKLPAALAELFVLYEQRCVPADRLARAVGITRNNLWIRLYRARLGLRECLHENWFEERRR